MPWRPGATRPCSAGAWNGWLARRAVLTLALVAVGGCHDVAATTSTAGRMRAADADVIDTMLRPDMQPLGSFVQAIQAAGLVDELSRPGPFTVFAPTNDAFAALPPGLLDDLLDPGHKARLRAVLLYHVHVGDAVLAADVRTMLLSTAEGHPLSVSAAGDGVTVNTAKVIKADVICRNGVIHWVDQVLLPPASGQAVPAAATASGT